MQDTGNKDDAPKPAPVPRNFTTHELEAVIRRAVDLETGSSARTEDGLSEEDIVRIGHDLGLQPMTVRRAIAEVRTGRAEEKGALIKIAGPRTVRVSRVVKCPSKAMMTRLDEYLRKSELMVVQRRFTNRNRYVRDASFAAGFERLARGFSRSHKPLNLEELDVAVSDLDADSCLVELSVDLAGTRGGLVAGVPGSAGVASVAWAVTVWATAIADPLMLLGIPVIAGSWFGMRAIYSTIRNSVEEKLESLLDRLEAF